MKNWRSLRVAELVVAALLLMLGVGVLFATATMRVGFAEVFQPKLFPSLIGWLVIVTSIALGLSAARTPAVLSVAWPPAPAARRVATILGSIAAYLAAIDLIGMPLATMIVVWFQVRFLGRYRPYVPIAVGVISGIVVHVVFTEALDLMFPTGFLDR